MILEGPSETGKTMACLYRLNNLAWQFKGAQFAIVRKRHVDLQPSVLQTYEKKILGTDTPIKTYGGEKAEFYDYPNGSRIWTGGLDIASKVLSSERDIIFVNQCEELTSNDWEVLTTRVTGRAGNLPFSQIIGDMNPAGLSHWIYAREAANKVLVLPTSHKDNPTLYNDDGQLTLQGEQTLQRLSALTGVLRIRLFEGKRASVAGLVYGEVWDENDGSVTEDAEYVKDGGPVFWAADDGYSAGGAPQSRGQDPQTGYYVADAHPRVFLLCQLKSDGHLDVFAESYRCLTLTDKHIAEVLQLPYPRPEFAAYGPGAAEFRGRLYAAHIPPHQCVEQVETRIQELRGWLAKDKNGWRRIRVHPRVRQLRAEMLSYSYDPQSQKPVKSFDHGPDALNYLVWVLRGMRR